MNEASLIALVAALFGGAGLKIIETLLNKHRDRRDISTQLRSELREEIRQLRVLLQTVQSDLDRWRDRYYRLLSAFNELKFILVREGIRPKELPDYMGETDNE